MAIATSLKRYDPKSYRYSRHPRRNSRALEKLLFAYCDHLKDLGRDFHRDARSIFTLHIVGTFPCIAHKPAAQMTPEEIADMMRMLLDAHKDRTANKLRSHVRAACQTAKGARLNTKTPIKFKDFKVVFNPASETVPDCAQNKSGKNPLDQDELITYWMGEDKLWEIRMTGRDGIARAVYVTRTGKLLTVLHVFIKKTQKTPRKNIAIAYERLRSLNNE